MMWEETDSESSDEEKQIDDLRRLEEAALKANAAPTTEPTPDLSKLSEKDQKRYENIRAAYGLNKILSEKLVNFEKQLIVRLKECREKLQTLQAESNATKMPEKLQIFRYVNCGKPYFKDREGCPPPDNEDTLTMTKAGMFDFCDIQSVPGWTLRDKATLMEQILITSRKIRKAELTSKVAELARRAKKEDCKDIQMEIRKLKREIDTVSKLPLEEVVKPVEEDYDWEAIADALNERHTPQEYRSIWKLFLHPSINKKSWNRSEHLRLQEIVHSFRLQDWDEIAKTLNTGRTGYQCFVYFRTHMGNTLRGAKWSKEEEEYLSRLIEYYREDDYIPWGKVAASMENRTKIQIYNKYFRMNELRKGRFLPEEDAVLLTCIENFGKNWRKVTTYLPGRSASQVRMRYYVLSNGSNASVVWTVEEDKKLIQLMANQDSILINYAALTKFFPGKDRVQLRARYTTLTRWMKRHPNRDLSCAPRRGARRLTHGYSNKDLDTAVANLKKRIQSEVEIVKSKKINRNSSEDAIEHAIVNTLITETVREEACKKQSSEFEETTSDGQTTRFTVNENNLKNTLLLLRASLRKDLFCKSNYHKQYPNLVKDEAPKTVTLKLKSYSKKARINEIPIDCSGGKSVNIWDNPPLTSQSVLPPNYSTITGCRRLMALATNANMPVDNRLNISQIMRKNSVAKEQIELFMERFTTLFLWPMLLSNENPKIKSLNIPDLDDIGNYPRNNQVTLLKDYPLRLHLPDVAIPTRTSATTNDENIDLSTNGDDEKGDIIVTTYIGNDDFMYLNNTCSEGCLDNEPNAPLLEKTKNRGKMRRIM